MTGNQDIFQKAINLGHSAAWDQQWAQAAVYYRQALAEIPDHPAALTSLGLALFEQKEYGEAMRVYQRAAALSTGDPVPLEKMARIYELQGRSSEAIQAALQAAELQLKAQEIQKAVQNWLAVLNWQPENLAARTRLAFVYERTGRKAEAVTEYLAAASILQHLGDLPRAAQLAEYACKVMPDHPDARKSLGMIRSGQMLQKAGKPRRVTGPMRSSDTAKPIEPAATQALDPIAEARKDALEQLAALLFDQTDQMVVQPQASRRGLSALTRGGGGASDDGMNTRIQLHLAQAIESQSHGQDAQAAAELERAVEAGLISPAVFYFLGVLFHRSDRVRSLKYLQQSVKHPRYDLASYLLMGQNFEDNDDLVHAAGAYFQSLRLADLNTVPADRQEELDQIYETLQDSQSAQSDETRLKNICETVSAQLLRPGWRDFLKEARGQLPGTSVSGSIVPLAEMLLETRGGQVVELLSQIRQLAAQGKYRSAMEEAFYALQFAPTYLPLHIQIGDMLLKEGHTQAAISKFISVSDLYSLRGEAAQAVRLLTRIMQMVPTDVGVRTALIDLLIAQGRVEEAVQQYMDMAQFYYQISDLEKARQTYLSALRLPLQGKSGRALSVQILRKVADIDLQRLDLRSALKIFEQIRTLQPEDVEARASLIDLHMRLGQQEGAYAELDGYIGLLESLSQREQAIQFLEEMLNDHPERMDLRSRLADLYQRSGQTEQAVKQLDALADALLVSRNRPAAVKVLEKIIQLNPPNLAEYRAALAQLKNS